jgi:CheY-like chemotaxis protein
VTSPEDQGRFQLKVFQNQQACHPEIPGWKDHRPQLWGQHQWPREYWTTDTRKRTNARDAMPNGGTLRITASSRHLTRGQGELPPDSAEGTYICLSVSDDGVGMDEETRQRVFEPFFTTKPRGRGTGLGLATVFGIVTQSAGFIRVSSQPGRGSRFDLFFPRSSQPVDLIVATASVAPARGVERILVVEDDDGVRAVVSMILAEAGYDILQARSLRQARAMLDEHDRSIALVITDLVLTDGHGLDLVSELRKRRPSLPVLCMSGYAEREGDDGSMLGLMQGIAHLQKPFSFDDLLSKVRSLLDAAPAERKRPVFSA